MVPRWLVWPLVAAVMGFALGGSFVWGVRYSPPQQRTADNHQSNELTAEKEKKNGFWEKAADDPVAYFTLWLVGFTGILALSTAGLWVSTRQLWVAAKSSEVALRTLERPYVVIDPRTNRSGALADLEVHIVNHGRSLAFVGVAQGDFYIQDEPPRQFIPLKEHEQGVHWVLPGHGKGKVLQWPIRGKTAEELERVKTGAAKLYFVAVISYRDAADNWYDTGICVTYDAKINDTSAAGGPEHNFMT
ncbi:hypothetical protein ABIB82_005571 [Bradyrhizobium sp. i1.8.4]|uniref:hypothetical protein n=1 Tax=unclassified Bradyrhizobium TaxID=2631580 RepID=UPI003D1CF239